MKAISNIQKQMKITSREAKVLCFINEFGFCNIRYLQRLFKIKHTISYKIMKRLKEKELVIHEKIFHGQHGIFRLTRKGAAYTSMREIKNIPKDNYDHQLMIIDVYLKLRELYPDAHWISERELKKEKFKNGLGRRGHIADGILVMPDQKQIAIEVELTQKSKERLQEIWSGYSEQFDLNEVWYFCAPHILSHMETLASSRSYIKIFNLMKFLA